jgi:WD40 repeat protein
MVGAKGHFMHHIGPIAGVAAHGSWVATAGYDNRLILWDAARRVALARVDHDHLVNACDFSHDGRWLVSASSDYTARIWSLPDLRLSVVLAGHGDDVDMARFSPDDRLIATCALDRIVRVYARDGRLIHAMAGHTGNVLSLAWLDGARFVTTSVDGTLREWHAATGVCRRVIEIGMRTDCVAVAPDGTIVAGDDRGRIAVLAGAGSIPEFTPAHRAGIKKLVLSRDGTRLVTLGYDRALGVWDMGHGAPRLVAMNAMPTAIWARAAAVLPDGRIAVGTFGGAYALFDPASEAWDCTGVTAGPALNAVTERYGALVAIGDAGVVLTEGVAGADLGSLCNFVVPAAGRLFAGGHLGELYDGESGQILHRHHAPLNCAASFARGGVPHLAVGTYTGEILVFALAATVQLVKTIAAHGNAVKALCQGYDRLFSVCANGTLAWHDTETLTERRRVERAHTRIANAGVALGDGGFASVGRDRVLRLWLPGGLGGGLGGGDHAFATPHPNSVKALAASPCGRWIASGSYGGTVVIFDRADNSFAPMQRISKAGIAALCWSTRAGAFVAADYAGALHIVALPVADAAKFAVGLAA